jgi:hypothetical protein
MPKVIVNGEEKCAAIGYELVGMNVCRFQVPGDVVLDQFELLFEDGSRKKATVTAQPMRWHRGVPLQPHWLRAIVND